MDVRSEVHLVNAHEARFVFSHSQRSKRCGLAKTWIP